MGAGVNGGGLEGHGRKGGRSLGGAVHGRLEFGLRVAGLLGLLGLFLLLGPDLLLGLFGPGVDHQGAVAHQADAQGLDVQLRQDNGLAGFLGCHVQLAPWLA